MCSPKASGGIRHYSVQFLPNKLSLIKIIWTWMMFFFFFFLATKFELLTFMIFVCKQEEKQHGRTHWAGIRLQRFHTSHSWGGNLLIYFGDEYETWHTVWLHIGVWEARQTFGRRWTRHLLMTIKHSSFSVWGWLVSVITWENFHLKEFFS